MKICPENPNLDKIRQNYWYYTWRPKCIVLLLATLNQLTSTLFKWNGIRLLRHQRRCKTLPNVFISTTIQKSCISKATHYLLVSNMYSRSTVKKGNTLLRSHGNSF